MATRYTRSALSLREKQKELDDLNSELKGLLTALPSDDGFATPSVVNTTIRNLRQEEQVLRHEIDDVDNLVEPGTIREYLKQRRVALLAISKQRRKLNDLESTVANVEFELREVSEYEGYLQDILEKLLFAEATLTAIGSIEFTHCPACGNDLEPDATTGQCVVCKSPLNTEREKSRYNQIRLDIEIQARESRQLVSQKESELTLGRQESRRLRHQHQQNLVKFELEYGGGNGPREAFLAARINRLGHIEAEISHLLGSLELAEKIEQLSDKRVNLIQQIDAWRTRSEILQREARNRRSVALTTISEVCTDILRADLDRQEEFLTANTVELDFKNDSISVDGSLNFAESSNVYLKNAAVFGIFLAAGTDEAFYHPRFVLIDNVEDKGMEVKRSHLFQRKIVERATELPEPYQVIFTTSMMNPELELDEYIIGPAYNSDHRSLTLDWERNS